MSKIFLDSGNPEETKEAVNLLRMGRPNVELTGQTTNPSLIAKNLPPHLDARCGGVVGKKMVEIELLSLYKKIVTEISNLIPSGSVSIEVYSDEKTSIEEMISQGKMMNSWISNAHIKLPITANGLAAAEKLVGEGVRVNMTLCFSQEQAAAVHAATRGAKKGDVFISPFIGRLDDRGENGMDLIKNIFEMYKTNNSHVELLTASVRNVYHLIQAMEIGSDIVTCPIKIIKEWNGIKPFDSAQGKLENNLRSIEYKKIDLNQSWQSFDIHHELTDIGLAKFAFDWKSVLI